MSYLVSGNNPAAIKTAERNVFTATAGQTVFPIIQGYQVGDVDVFLNGIRLVDSDDFNASNGTTIVLTTGALVGDSLVVVCYRPFQVADFYTKSEQDTRYVNTTGDTMTGTLVAPFIQLDRRSWTDAIRIGTTNKDFVLYREWAGKTDSISIGNYTDSIENIRFDNNGRVTLPNQPGVRLHGQGGSVPIAPGIVSQLTQTNFWGTANPWNGSRFTAPVAGRYFISMMGNANVDAATLSLETRKNNASVVGYTYIQTTASYWVNAGMYTVIDLAASDYIEFYNRNGNLRFDSGGWFNINIGLLA